MSENTIDRLDIQVQTQAQKANADLDKLVGKLERMSSSLNRLNAGGLKNLANGVDTLGRSVQNMSTVKTSDFTRLAKNIEKLGNINQAGINNTANALRQMSSALTANPVSGEALKGLSDLANGISRLGYKSVSNAISNLPLLANSMRQFMSTLSTAPQVSQNLIQMTNAMANLASQGSKYNSTIKSMGSAAKNLAKSNNEAHKSNVSFMAGITKLTVGFYVLRRAVRAAFEPTEKAMNIGETINLFQTSFKKIGMEAAQDAGMSWGSEAANAYAMNFIDQAQSFNNRITEALSLDPNTVMNYQAVFAQMSNAFGLTNESVMNLSKSFTMLGLDMASFFNTGVEEAMVKLRAGLAGETEPLRSLGIDITEATLKMTALKYGINGTVSEMSQAAKTQLRWLAIMDQADTVFGDMAKTIDQPAAQVRILQQQLENLSRSIGTIFIPIISKVLPYVNAFFIALRKVADTIATAMGYELPNYTDSDIYKDVTGGIDGIGDSADDSTGSVNKLKKALASFDQLNVLSEGKSKGVNIGSGGYPVLDDAIANKTDSYMKKFNDELGNMKNKAEELANKIEPKIKAFVQFIKDLSPLLAGAAASMGALAIINFFTGLGGKIATLANTPGLPVALAIGGIIAIYLAVKEYNKKLMQEDLEGRFGKIALSMQEIDRIATKLTTNKYTANIDIYVNEKIKLAELEQNIQKDLETLNKLNWKISVGLELTPEEQETYKLTIEKFITDSEAYVEQQQYVVNLAIDAVIQGDTAFNDEITQLINDYFNANKEKMNSLGKKLRKAYDDAFADGVLDAEEQKVIDNMIAEYNKILSAVSDAEFKAKLQMIEIEGDITPDSFKNLSAEVQKAIDEKLSGSKESYFTSLAYVNMAYEAKIDATSDKREKIRLKKEWDEKISQLADEFGKTKANVSLEGVTFLTDILYKNYEKELSAMGINIRDFTKETFSKEFLNSLKEVDPTTAINTLMDVIKNDYQLAWELSGMDGISAKGLQEMLAALEPTEAQNKELYDTYIESGKIPPQALIDQMSATETLRALTGQDGVDGMYYAIGQQMANSPEILAMISNGELSAKLLPEGVIRGMKSVIPDLKLTADGLVMDIDKTINTASKESKKNMPNYSKLLVDGYKSTFDKDTSMVSSVTKWLQGVNDTINNWKVPQVKVPAPDISALQAQINGQNIWDLKVKGYASGGQPNTGEFFMARENGIPEYVGRMGGKTTVANNADISAGIEEAAYRGYMRAVIETRSMSNSAPVVEVPLYLDGEELARGIYNGRQSYEGRMNPVRVGG